MPMPQDLEVVFEDGETIRFHIPLVMMRGHRPIGSDETLAEDWPWTNPTYELTVPSMGKKISRVDLDPDRQADVNLKTTFTRVDNATKGY